MKLRFTVHLDDYHSNITAHWQTLAACVAHVNEERDGGYDVDRITVDGHALFCSRTLRGAPCPNPVESIGADICITHRHEDAYNDDFRSYKGD